MGLYINPPDQSKEDWLANNAKSMHCTPPAKARQNLGDGETVVVCLVVNGGFTAAGVAFNDRELRDFADPNDQRPKVWLLVPVEKVEEVTGKKLDDWNY